MVITSVTCDRAVAGDPAHVVSAQVDQHHVLGTLLRIGQQFFGQPAVFLFGRAAPPGAGQRADGDLPVDDAHHHFRRTAHQGDAGRADVEHERAGVDHPQRAVDLEGMGAQRHLQPLAGHDLEDVARADVLDALAHGRLELGLGEVRAVRQRHVAFRADVERLQFGRAWKKVARPVGRRGGRPPDRPGPA